MNKKMIPFLLSLLLTFGIAAACGEPAVSVPVPTEIADAAKSFTLDLYGEKSRTIAVSDYIDENGVAGVAYEAAASDMAKLSVSEIAEGACTVTALAEGTATVTVMALVSGEEKLAVTLSFTVTDSAPGAPLLSQEAYAYDKSVGGAFELPVGMNGGAASLVKLEGARLQERLWSYDAQRACVVMQEELMLSLPLGDYAATLITTGGSAAFTLSVVNTVTTSFDAETQKTAALGKAGSVVFDVGFNGTTVRKITYGEYILDASEYEATADGIEIKEAFYAKTYAGDNRSYTLYLSNNDTYEFSIVTNKLFYSDYNVTTIHDERESTTGQNSLFQDSTRVEVVEAPEGFHGKALKFTPHTEDVPLNVHGIYTLEKSGNSSTWHKVNFVNGKQYIVSFDYMTMGTSAGEDFRFRSWSGGLRAEPLDTGRPGQKQRFSYAFEWSDAYQGVFLFGKFVNGGDLIVDNFSVVEADALPTASAGAYTGEDQFTLSVEENGYLLREVLVDGAPVKHTIAPGSVTIDGEALRSLPFGTHTVTLCTSVWDVHVDFEYEDSSIAAELSEHAKAFARGVTTLKLAGTFGDGVAVTSLTRRGENAFDPAFSAPQPMSASYVRIESDGIVLDRALLDQVYGTCTYEITFSTGAKETFALTSNALYYTDFDETNLWNGVMAEDPGVASVVPGGDGFSGNALKLATANWQTHEPYTWFTRVLCFGKNGAYDWPAMNCDDDKYYEFFFDFKVEMNGAPAHTALGYYYIKSGANGEVAISTVAAGYEDGAIRRFSVVMKGGDFDAFAIGLDPREGDLKSVMYIDNFGIAEVPAPVA